jgi:hypothetical protein
MTAQNNRFCFYKLKQSGHMKTKPDSVLKPPQISHSLVKSTSLIRLTSTLLLSLEKFKVEFGILKNSMPQNRCGSCLGFNDVLCNTYHFTILDQLNQPTVAIIISDPQTLCSCQSDKRITCVILYPFFKVALCTRQNVAGLL